MEIRQKRILLILILVAVVVAAFGPSVVTPRSSFVEGSYISRGFPVAYVFEFGAMRAFEDMQPRRIMAPASLALNLTINVLLAALVYFLFFNRRDKERARVADQESAEGRTQE